MKVVGVVGSPRQEGSTALLVGKVLEGARSAGAETVLHQLGSMSYGGCRACMGCRSDGCCVQKDDMQAVYEDLRAAGGAVLGTPVYMLSMTGQTKLFIDRLFALMKPDFSSRLGTGMPLVMVVTQGAPDPESFKPALDSMTEALDMLGLHEVDRIAGTGLGSAKDAMRRKDLLEKAFEAGRKLAGG
jgi:multimeric flavodoxin WrbA